MGNYKRPAVVFNLDNPMQKDLYEWCISQSSNFSDFARTVIFLYRQQHIGLTPKNSTTNPTYESNTINHITNTDIEAMSEML